MNDAHIYCTEEQIKDEFIAVIRMHQEVYEVLGLSDFYMRFSTSDATEKGKEKYVDDPQAWETTQHIVREAMNETGVPYVEGKGEAAFYGPKIDVQFRTVTGREETASTNHSTSRSPRGWVSPTRAPMTESIAPTSSIARPWARMSASWLF